MPPRKQKPSIGRVVHFWPRFVQRDNSVITSPEPYPATITRVNPGGSVNLAVIRPGALLTSEVFVPEATEPTPNHWTWPERV